MSNSTNLEHQCGGTTGGPPFKWVLGIIICLAGSVMNTVALVLQKWAHDINRALPDDSKYAEFHGILCSPMWWTGHAIICFCGIPTDLAAISLIPQSVMAPLSGFTIVCTQIVAPWILRETVTRLDALSVGIILTGCTLTTAFGDHCSKEYRLNEVAELAQGTAFLVAELFVPVILAVVGLCKYYLIEKYVPEDDQHRFQASSTMLLAGLMGAHQNIMFKVVGEQVEQMTVGNADVWHTPAPNILAVLTVALAIWQVSTMNKGLKQWTAVKTLPLYNVCLILFSSTFGGIFYQELSELPVHGLVLYPIGVIIVLFGILLLLHREEKPEEKGEKDEFVPCSKVAPSPAAPLRGEDTFNDTDLHPGQSYACGGAEDTKGEEQHAACNTEG